MSLPGIDGFTTKIVDLIKRELEKMKPVRLYVVTGVNKEAYTVQIKDARRAIQYDNVRIAGTGLGHMKGLMKLPAVGDWVVVAFLGVDSLQPIVIGSLYDDFSQNKDTIPKVEEDELVLIHKTAGSFLTMKPDGTIIARTVGADGDPDGGSRFKIAPDGSFKLFNKGNYGVEVDSSGNMTLRAVTINATQTGGTWP